MRSATTGQFLAGIGIGDVTIRYLRWGAAAKVDVTPQTMTQGTFTSGGWVETDISGIYQFGVPNAAIVAGAKGVDILFSASGAIDFEYNAVIVGYDAGSGDWETEASASSRATTNQTEHDATQTQIAALNDPSAAAVADAVWDEAKADHVAAGSFGKELQDTKTVVDFLEDILVNRLKFDKVNKQWVLYADNETTELKRWDAKDVDGVATDDPGLATERDPV